MLDISALFGSLSKLNHYQPKYKKIMRSYKKSPLLPLLLNPGKSMNDIIVMIIKQKISCTVKPAFILN